MKKKVLLILFCMVFVSIFSTVMTTAYLTDTATSEGVYTFGDVKIKLDESNVDELGRVIDDKRVLENKYHLMPGYTYKKDPVITVMKNSTDTYIRILITVSDTDKLKKIYGDNFTIENIYSGWGENWSYYGKETLENTTVYEYRYNLVVSAKDKNVKLEPLFNEFIIPGDATIEDLKEIEDLEISIVGQAIQTQGFDNVDMAWESFNK